MQIKTYYRFFIVSEVSHLINKHESLDVCVFFIESSYSLENWDECLIWGWEGFGQGVMHI